MKASRTFIVKEGKKVVSLDGERLEPGSSVTIRLASISKREFIRCMDWIGGNESSLEEVEDAEPIKPAAAQSYATRDMSAAPAPAPAVEPAEVIFEEPASEE